MKTFPLLAGACLAAQLSLAAAQGAAPLARVRNYVEISDRVATGGQPAESQFADLAKAGYALVVNLSPPFVKLNDRESLFATAAGMSYVQIPVDFKQPSLRDLEFFFALMNANRDRKVFVHCESNLRTSVFVYLWQVVHGGAEEAWARSQLQLVWEPYGAWPAFIGQALAHYRKK